MSGVASNFSPKYVGKTFELIKNFQGGNAIFTMPTLPIKCPGAPQKIMYLAEDYWRHRVWYPVALLQYVCLYGVAVVPLSKKF